MKNKFTIILFLLLLISCSKNKDIKGFWHSEDKDNKVLLNFINDKECINYFYYRDTINYILSRNKLYWNNGWDTPLTLKTKITDSELFFYKYKTDSLLIKYQKSNQRNYLFDYLNDKTLTINLPEGNGEIRRYGTDSYHFSDPLYLTYQEGELIINFNNTSKLINDNYYRFLRKNISHRQYGEYVSSKRISLIADKNVKMKDIVLLEKHLRLAGFVNIHYLNETDEYDEVNYFGMRMLPLPQEDLEKYDLDFTEEDKYDFEETSKDNDEIVVVTSNYEKEEKIMFKYDYRDSIFIDVKPRARLLEIDKSEVKLDNKIRSLEELKNIVKSSLSNSSDFEIMFYITDDSTYQNFISVLEAVQNPIEELRKEYLFERYSMKYPLVRNNPQSNYTIEKDRIREAKMKFPFIFYRMNFEEYNEVKKSL